MFSDLDFSIYVIAFRVLCCSRWELSVVWWVGGLWISEGRLAGEVWCEVSWRMVDGLQVRRWCRD